MNTVEIELLRYYAEDAHNRKYHGVKHILDLLQLMNTNALPGLKPLPSDQVMRLSKKRYVGWGLVPMFVEPSLITAAIYGHDIIYDSERKDNEEQSAQITCSLLQRHGWNLNRANVVRDLILATKPPHNVPSFIQEDMIEDCQLLLSMDLAVGLAVEGEKMHQATADIRFEYRQFNDEEWNAGRTAFFTSMLNKAEIFPHSLCEATWGPIARKNMEEGLKRLAA